MTATATYRDYTNGLGDFSIETFGCCCNLRVGDSSYYFDEDTARSLGTALLAWGGADLTCTVDPVPFGDLLVDVIDGDVTFILRDGTTYQPDRLDDVTDLGQRLIVWAGVNLNHPAAV